MSADRIGNYEIVRMLARGGMAVVYLVHQAALDRDVVLKRLDLEGRDPALAQRFVREARLAATLDHPNVVTLFDFFEHDGVPYIAMEYVAGGSLRELVGRLELPQVCGLVEGVLAGLGHAESQRIAHRDLKPENLLLTRRGNVKIADFGIARAYDALTQRLTVPGMAIGTPAYMAPEQATNDPIGPATDLYALGVIVYELLAGRPPFTADTPVGLLYAHVHSRPPPLAALVAPEQRAVCGWVEWLLAKDPADRPQSAAAAWDALEEVAVAQMGPYWRRGAAVRSLTPPPQPAAIAARAASATGAATTEEGSANGSEDSTRKLPTPTPLAPPAQVPRARVRRRRALIGGAALLAAAAATAAFMVPGGDEPESSVPTPTPVLPPPQRAATPYDFDSDGRQELVIALLKGAPRGRRAHSGVVLVKTRRKRPAWNLITEARAGLRGRPRLGDDFGSGLASADFDRDGHADLAIGTPGRERVSVIYGSRSGLDDRRVQQLKGGNAGLPARSGRYGYTIVARDLDGDGYGDLVAGAPGEADGQPRSGALHIVFGGPKGLGPRDRVIPRPEPGMSNFGQRLRTGDVDGDGHRDLAEGAPARGTGSGHATYCRSGRRGPLRCRLLPAAGNTSALAIGDINGDGRADIVQGDSQRASNQAALIPGPGLVRVWWGSRDGPRSPPLVITQDSLAVRDIAEAGDEFGAVVEASDLDQDGYDDLIVSAPREDDGAGRVIVIRGWRDGYAHNGGSAFDQGYASVPGEPEPGVEFGSTLSVLRYSRDKRPDVILAVRGASSADDRVMVVQSGRGIFNPQETRTTVLAGVAPLVDAPAGGRIRLARPAGS